jgi:hypothetical protein
MSLLAWSVTAVPASSRALMAAADRVLVPPELVANVCGLVSEVPVPDVMISTRPVSTSAPRSALRLNTNALPLLNAVTPGKPTGEEPT